MKLEWVRIGSSGVMTRSRTFRSPRQWSRLTSAIQTIMSVLNLTKYPPSADFLLLTLSVGALLLAGLERAPGRLLRLLSVYGGTPLFFPLIHLYALHLLYLGALALF